MTQNRLPDTQNKILMAAKTEFLELGFMGASLRNIVKNAGVTTGAFYGYYPDKKALFDALVVTSATTLQERMSRLQENFADMPAKFQMSDMYSFSIESLRELFDFIYENFDAFKLLICHSAGTDYEHYIDSLVEIECANTERFTLAMHSVGFPVADISANLNHVLANGYFSAIFEAVVHDMPRKDADEYVSGLTKFFHAGWEMILKQ